MRSHLSIIAFLMVLFVSSQETNNVTICWDTSLSMMERDIEKEFEILDKITCLLVKNSLTGLSIPSKKTVN